MKLVLVAKDDVFMPTIDRLIPGAMLQYQGHVYVKVDIKKTGQDVYINHPTDCCVLFNPKYGSTRKIQKDTKVELLGLCEDEINVYVTKNRFEINNQLRW